MKHLLRKIFVFGSIALNFVSQLDIDQLIETAIQGRIVMVGSFLSYVITRFCEFDDVVIWAISYQKWACAVLCLIGLATGGLAGKVVERHFE
ncbi:hypothetical protein BH10PLA2_BH10PLA2_33920 [soil metagenome]